MRNLQSEDLMQNANDANMKEPTTTPTETLGSKSIIVSQNATREAGRVYHCHVWICTKQPIAGVNSLLQACITAQKSSSSSPLPQVFHLLLLLGVLQDALGFQASPCLLKSPSLNAALKVMWLHRSRVSLETYLVSGLNQ
jgi:hypothetical protein